MTIPPHCLGKIEKAQISPPRATKPVELIGRKNCSNKTTADTTEKNECKNTAITTNKLLQQLLQLYYYRYNCRN